MKTKSGFLIKSISRLRRHHICKQGEKGHMNKIYVGIVFLIAIMFLSGCAVIGRGKDFRPFDEQVLVQVIPGQTTAAEITKLFGAPSQIVKLSNGNAYVYNRTLSKATGIWLVLVTMANYDIQHDRIVFFINQKDVVTHYGSSFRSETAAYGTPF
jgi:hypothetical protein